LNRNFDTTHPLSISSAILTVTSVAPVAARILKNPTRKPVRSVKFSKPWDECITYKFTAHVTNELKLKREGNESSTLKRFPKIGGTADLGWGHDHDLALIVVRVYPHTTSHVPNGY